MTAKGAAKHIMIHELFYSLKKEMEREIFNGKSCPIFSKLIHEAYDICKKRNAKRQYKEDWGEDNDVRTLEYGAFLTKGTCVYRHLKIEWVGGRKKPYTDEELLE